jgi:hypothetical protein
MPDKKFNPHTILKFAFLQIPKARKLYEEGRYHKKVFACCYYLKHKAFLKDPLFKEPGTVVISGIKYGDGKQRRLWLTKLAKEGTFYHRHVDNQLYCYPFRDYRLELLPDKVVAILKTKYPNLKSSGCSMCPVLVLFNLREEGERYNRSVDYWFKLCGQTRLF